MEDISVAVVILTKDYASDEELEKARRALSRAQYAINDELYSRGFRSSIRKEHE